MIAAIEQEALTKPVKPLAEKQNELRNLMRGLGRVLVAYSGGVDSSYLAAVATEELGSNAVCVTGLSPSVSEFQRKQAREIAETRGFDHRTIETAELADPNYLANDTNRCFFCKDELYSKLASEAEMIGAVVLDGTNAEDLADHRPGRAAAANHKVRSPLAELGFTKGEIRAASLELGLPTWDVPASPCLSSRIATGVPVTIERLSKVERAEEFLRSLGFKEFRVRVHSELARIEIAKDEMERVLDLALFSRIEERFRSIGFQFTTLDLGGFRSGSTNGTVLAGTEDSSFLEINING